ncbi:hypothetical protein CBR_g4539 [Chara braunii]|uniref:Integrase zinc-binding domain-containing protein n=1 Tax=Chara braunii TaxID=69332 RepID=A0A388KI67_CHABU|nr:hypothetical protein CBR_g4539 [Chara braunii]|eukprot:GBG69708.1 hypothetical protein CBR_g4539 [Chara braunii]
MQQEASHTTARQEWNFVPTERHPESTAKEQTKAALFHLMHQLLTCNFQQVELARQIRIISYYEETHKSFHTRLEESEKDDVPHRHMASSSTDPSVRELGEQTDHLVALIENLNNFQWSATIGQRMAAVQADLRQLQQQPTGTCNSMTPRQYKMSKFSIEKFDDYNTADPMTWWQGFTNELAIHLVPPESKVSALYICSTAASQVWLNHLAQTEGVEVAALYTKLTWEAVTEKWRKRFIVDDAQGKGANRIFTMHQGSQPTREWLTEWQKNVTISNLNIPFVHLCREFFQRSIDGLSTTLGEHNLYTDFDQIVDKAREVIQSNRWGQDDDQVLTHESSEGDGVNALPPRRNKKKKKAKSMSTTQRRRPPMTKLEKLSSAGSEATPLPSPPDMVTLLATSSTPREHAYVASLQESYEDYAVQLVPPLDQPLHVQESYACATSSPSPTEPPSSPTLLGDSSVWSRLENLDRLTSEDFQWMPLPPFGYLSKPHCNALMVELRNYLHVAIPTLVMEYGAAVVDVREYIAKIDREYAMQRHYRVVDGYLLLHSQGKDLLCVPHDCRLRTCLLDEYHDSRLAAHFGVNCTIARLRQRFRWSDLITDVTQYCDSCEVCQRSKPLNRNPYGELRPLPIPREPDLSMAMDVTGPFPPDRFGHDGILTVADRLSKYARFLPSKYYATAPELARLLHTGWICGHDIPEYIVSDHDILDFPHEGLQHRDETEFGSASTKGRASGGGTSNRPNDAPSLIRLHQKDRVDCLPDIEFAYNTSLHPAIGVTPLELHHGGRKGRIFANLTFPRTVDINAACSPASDRKYRDLLAKACTNMQKAQVRMQQQANRRCVPCPIRAGNLVWVSTEEFALEQDVSLKLLPKWFGPWTVTSTVGDEPDGPSFVIEIPSHLTIHPIFHASKLAAYTPAKRDNFLGRRSQDPPMDGHQEVERIIMHHKHDNKPMQYKVTLKWCDCDDTRWISRAALQASAPLIYAEYEKQRLTTGAAKPAPPTRTRSLPPTDSFTLAELHSIQKSHWGLVLLIQEDRKPVSLSIFDHENWGLPAAAPTKVMKMAATIARVGITVTDDVLGEAVMACDMIEEEGGDVFGTVRSRARNEVGTFGQAADNDVDAIMPAVGLGEAAHEVHGDGLPTDRGNNGVVSADGEVLPVELRAPNYEGVNHGEDFLVVGGVIHLRGKELLACEGDGVFAGWTLGVSGRVLDGGGLGGVAGEMLGQYGSNGEVGGVSGDIEMASGVGDLEDRGRGDGLLDGDNVAEVFDARSSKRTFVELGVEFLLSEDREDLANMLEVGLEGGAKDEDVIKIHDDIDFEEVSEDVIHGGLECGGGIGVKVRGGELVRGGGGRGVLRGDVVEEVRAGRGRPANDGEPMDDGDAVKGEGLLEFGEKEEDILMGLAREGVVVLGEEGSGATMVEVVVDEGGGVHVDGVGVEVEAEACPEEGVEEGGVAVVTTVTAGQFPSSMVTRSKMAAMVVLIVAREDLRAVNVWRIVASSKVVVVEVG